MRPVRAFTLTARHARMTLPGGSTVDALTYNGTLPGPELRVREGDLVEVRLHNADIAEGVTIHWHGYDVPAGEDGVAGVTQDAVPVGGSFTYRFLAEQVGTFWYHSHQNSYQQVWSGPVRGTRGRTSERSGHSGHRGAVSTGSPAGRRRCWARIGK